MTDDTIKPGDKPQSSKPASTEGSSRPKRRNPARRRRPQKEGARPTESSKSAKSNENTSDGRQRPDGDRRRRRRRPTHTKNRGDGTDQSADSKNNQAPNQGGRSRSARNSRFDGNTRRTGSRGPDDRNRNRQDPKRTSHAPAPLAAASSPDSETAESGRPSSPPRPNRRRSGRRSQPRKYSQEIPPGRMDRFSEIPEPPNTESVSVKDYEEMTDEQLTYLKVSTIPNEFDEEFEPFEIPKNSHLMDVVGIKLHPSDPITPFDSRELYLKKGDNVVVETKRGLSLGEVLLPTRRQYMTSTNLPRVIRVVSQGDTRQKERNKEKEDAAYRLCMSRIEKLKLPMKLISVEYVHGGNKAVFYFSAEGRVDFRELVRDLAQRLHTRIEMRQIGVRDVSRMVGGVGVCGCQLCCNLFLREFKPISIRMAKDQNLVLNPQKVSGVCGRLLCCLTYENDVYKRAAKSMPKIGRRVMTPDGEGRIRDRDVLKRIIRVQLNEETILKEYNVDDINFDVSTPKGEEQTTSQNSADREHNSRSNRESSRSNRGREGSRSNREGRPDRDGFRSERGRNAQRKSSDRTQNQTARSGENNAETVKANAPEKDEDIQ